MNKLIEQFNQVYHEPLKKEFLYEEGQTVRILKSLQLDTYNIKDLLGQKGIVSKQYLAGIYKEHKYEVTFPNGRTEIFDEEELDGRYKKRTQNR